jgi:integrase
MARLRGAHTDLIIVFGDANLLALNPFRDASRRHAPAAV